jgi:anaerobic ribonucleoside-triphosphate reductase activating protein
LFIKQSGDDKVSHNSGGDIDTLRVGNISEHSTIYGPGVRFVIWTQGCTLACKGCWNKQFWAKSGTKMKVNSLIAQIASTEGIEGITLLGGEPLQQAEPVLKIIQAVQKLGLSVFLYTGYDVEEFDKTMQACFDNSDIAITGRYIQEKRDTSLRWRGSTNQIVHTQSEFYNNLLFEERNEVEFVISEDGIVSMFGYPDEELRSWASEI